VEVDAICGVSRGRRLHRHVGPRVIGHPQSLQAGSAQAGRPPTDLRRLRPSLVRVWPHEPGSANPAQIGRGNCIGYLPVRITGDEKLRRVGNAMPLIYPRRDRGPDGGCCRFFRCHPTRLCGRVSNHVTRIEAVDGGPQATPGEEAAAERSALLRDVRSGEFTAVGRSASNHPPPVRSPDPVTTGTRAQ
jgi:hypothetical protein